MNSGSPPAQKFLIIMSHDDQTKRVDVLTHLRGLIFGNYPAESAGQEQTVSRRVVFFDQLRQEMSGIQGLDDRGATTYFHGRTSILERFEDLLEKAEETSGGSTFLVQGPPGIGKTALLAECWMKAAEAGWHVAEIDPDDLWDADKLQETLGLPPEKRGLQQI